jgi:methyl coenzyme M reductase subunit D
MFNDGGNYSLHLFVFNIFKENTFMIRKIKSSILEQDRDWQDANEVKPAVNQRVVIRMVNPDAILNKDEVDEDPDAEIQLLEGIAIGRYLYPLREGEEGSWQVDPPYPLYDYSPLTDKDKLKDGIEVSHWAVPAEGELEGWDNKFMPTDTYAALSLTSDERHKETIYRSLMYGSMYVGNEANKIKGQITYIGNHKDEFHAQYPDYNLEDTVNNMNEQFKDLEKLCNTLYDLQYCMDVGGVIENTQPVNHYRSIEDADNIEEVDELYGKMNEPDKRMFNFVDHWELYDSLETAHINKNDYDEDNPYHPLYMQNEYISNEKYAEELDKIKKVYAYNLEKYSVEDYMMLVYAFADYLADEYHVSWQDCEFLTNILGFIAQQQYNNGQTDLISKFLKATGKDKEDGDVDIGIPIVNIPDPE